MTNLTPASGPSAALVAPSDIAEMAGVSRGAVSNWRKRSGDFPAPVAGTTSKPLFDRAQVEAWLKATGKNVVTDHNLTAWSLLNTLRGELPYEDIAQLALDLGCLRRIHENMKSPIDAWTAISGAGADVLPAALRSGIDELERGLGLPSIPRGYAQVRPEKLALILPPFQLLPVEDLGAMTDYVLARAASAQVRAGVHHGFVESRISRILGALAGLDATGTIYDPACGIGEALSEVVRTHRSQAEWNMEPITRVVGHDISPAATMIARQRAFLRGEAWDLVTADVLAHDPDPELKANIVVCEPPFGQRLEQVELSDPRWVHGMPPRNSSELAWIQHAVAHLAPGGRAFVVTTMGALTRSGTEAAIRRSLVESGRIDAIIGLPGKLLPHVAMPLALWVLRPEPDHDGRILFADGSKSSNPESEIVSWYPEPSDDIPAELVKGNALASAGYDLNPARWTGAPSLDSDAAFATYAETLETLNYSLDRIAKLDRPLRAFDPLDRPRLVTVGELIDGGRIQLKNGRLRPEDVSPRLEENIIRPRHIRTGELPDNPPGVVLGDSEQAFEGWLSELESHPDRPRPGDVLITTTDEIFTHVYQVENAILGNGVQSLRVLTDEISPDYLAAVLPGAWNRRFFTGSTISRAKVQDLEVPLIGPDEQELYLAAFDRVDEVAEQAQLLAGRAAKTRVALLDLLRAGAPTNDAG